MSGLLYPELAAAFVRGRAKRDGGIALPVRLREAALGELSSEELDELARLGTEHGLRMGKFEKGPLLPRLRPVLGALHGLAPASVLDVGSGRGAFLWPLLDSFRSLPVTAVDRSAQ